MIVIGGDRTRPGDTGLRLNCAQFGPQMDEDLRVSGETTLNFAGLPVE
jgi:hypothetical protein